MPVLIDTLSETATGSAGAKSATAIPPTSPLGIRLRPALLVLAVALAATAIESTFGALPMPGETRGMDWLDAFLGTLPTWLVAAAMTPFIFAFARRFPFRSARWWEPVLVHLAGAAVFTMVHLAISVALTIFISGRPVPWSRAVVNMLRLYSLAEVLIYATVVGAWTALQFHREALARERDASQLRQRLVEARLDALRLQLQPHFLFNTLQAISVMARAQDTETLVRTVANLGDLLRAVLDERLGQEVTLDEELGLLRKYLDIQHVRFHDRLTVTWGIGDDCRVARVPSLILQPLVENAMMHGLDVRPGPGEIRIGAERDGLLLRMWVEDSGPGLAPQGARRRAGVGLANTRARLEHRYGERMRFLAHNAEQGGARFVIEIPYETVAADIAT